MLVNQLLVGVCVTAGGSNQADPPDEKFHWTWLAEDLLPAFAEFMPPHKAGETAWLSVYTNQFPGEGYDVPYTYFWDSQAWACERDDCMGLPTHWILSYDN